MRGRRAASPRLSLQSQERRIPCAFPPAVLRVSQADSGTRHRVQLACVWQRRATADDGLDLIGAVSEILSACGGETRPDFPFVEVAERTIGDVLRAVGPANG